jgi:hypothetical protein
VTARPSWVPFIGLPGWTLTNLSKHTDVNYGLAPAYRHDPEEDSVELRGLLVVNAASPLGITFPLKLSPLAPNGMIYAGSRSTAGSSAYLQIAVVGGAVGFGSAVGFTIGDHISLAGVKWYLN